MVSKAAVRLHSTYNEGVYNKTKKCKSSKTQKKIFSQGNHQTDRKDVPSACCGIIARSLSEIWLLFRRVHDVIDMLFQIIYYWVLFTQIHTSNVCYCYVIYINPLVLFFS